MRLSAELEFKELQEDIEAMQETFEELKEEVAKLRSNQEKPIEFQSLGFEDPDEAHSWIVKNCLVGSYGYVIDFHVLMEYIYQKLNGQDNLSRLEKLHKIKLKSNMEAIAISSFETMCPRFFSKSGDNEVIKT